MTYPTGKDHHNWKDNPTDYNWKHRRMEKLIEKPEVCNRCKIAKPVDLANISGEYKMEVSDWEYLCRKCHMESDGRNDTLRKFGHASKIHPDKNCLSCDKIITGHSAQKTIKYCGRECFNKSLKGKPLKNIPKIPWNKGMRGGIHV